MQSTSSQTPVFAQLSREFCASVARLVVDKHLTAASHSALCTRVNYLAKLADADKGRLHGVNFFFKLDSTRSKAHVQRGRTAYEALVKSINEDKIEKVHDIARVDGRFIYLVSLKKEPVWNKCWVEKVPPDALRLLRMNR